MKVRQILGLRGVMLTIIICTPVQGKMKEGKRTCFFLDIQKAYNTFGGMV